MSEVWRDISKRKKAEQASRIPKDWTIRSQNAKSFLDIPRNCGILTNGELDITENYDATALAEAIASKKLKCVDVTLAFCKRAAIAHQSTNCLTEIFFEDALARAAKLDERLAAGEPPIGPLHGVPVSLKDTFKVPGYDASIGFAALAFSPAKKASTLVEILLAAGAVLYCKTNVPQTLMALDSHNNIFGRTLNPRNTQVTAGGSTGGEGALIAMRGSILGVGTDVGGSIRIPAMCNGIYGFKPSWQRIPFSGQEGGSLPAMSKLALPASAGPLATSLRDCELFFRTIAASKPWELDTDVVPGYWDFQGECSPLNFTVGVVHSDGVVEPLPPIKKIITEVAQVMRKAGANVVDLNISHVFSKCQSLTNGMFGISNGDATFDLLEKTGEPLSPWLAGKMKRKAPKTVEGVRSLYEKREMVQKDFLEVWKGEGSKRVDVLICPVAPHPTPPIDRWNSVGYTSSFVLLDYPAGVIPVRRCGRADLEGELSTSPPLSSWDKANRKLWSEVDRSLYLDSALCVQVVAPKLQERRLYQAMKIIDDSLRAASFPDRQPAAAAKL